jgi:hypothetical protein
MSERANEAGEIQPLAPSVVDLNDAVQIIHILHRNGATNHVERTVELQMPEDRSAVVAGYLHREKGEGSHQHRVGTVLLVLAGQFRVVQWDGSNWVGGVCGPNTLINMGPDTPHLVEPHNPRNPDELNIIMVQTLDVTSFAPGDGYNQPLPDSLPPIPAAILHQTEPARTPITA